MGGLLSFVAVSLVIIVTPGQDTALTIRNTLQAGRGGGICTAVGVSLGQATWTLAASTGLGALLAASEPVFFALKLGGSGYLVFLGAQALFRARHLREGQALPSGTPAFARLPPITALRQGLLSNLGNPKMLAFFTGLLPPFASSFAGLIIRGGAFCALTLGWLTACTFAIARANALMRRPRALRLVEALTGTVLVALGVRLATEQHW